MRFLALIINLETRSYEKKDKTKIEQVELTCIDFDESGIRLKDTVDVTIPKADFTLIKGSPIGRQFWFDVTEIRPNPYGPRLRFTARLEITQFQAGGSGPHANEQPELPDAPQPAPTNESPVPVPTPPVKPEQAKGPR